MSVTDEKILDNFIKLGMTTYEAKAYLALLRCGESYGSEISKNSLIPGAKIYETLDRLVEKGLAYLTKDNPVCYQALPLEDYLNNKQNDFNLTIDFLKDKSDIICKGGSVDLLWYLSDREQLITKAQEYINIAKSKIFISLWPDEAQLLKPHLRMAVKRNVNVVSIQFNGHHLDEGTVYRHFMSDQVRHKHGSEMFLIVDSFKGMFMFYEESYGWKGFYTSSKGICRVIENYITHDIYINRIISEHKDFVFENYGEKLEKLLEL